MRTRPNRGVANREVANGDPANGNVPNRDGTDRLLMEQDVAPTWQQFAACVHHAGRVDFFPARGESTRDAKAVCAGCPVREECLEFALRLKVAHGVWGGLSERERRTLRRDRHRSASAKRLSR
jgi:WhiB family redox-sensing transcriptional regulator